ncbi:MAG: toll/interleukin-1 receptor domain-containing protein [Prevotella sp.]|nr:toll/interleukin-1 receptor domain-containing protein [Prevotella sp.]
MKITEGKTILQELEMMRETSGMAINVTYYIAEDVAKNRKRINKWQLTCKDVLINAFGESHRYVSSYTETVTQKNIGYNYKIEFQNEVEQGLSILEGILESLELGIAPPTSPQKSNSNTKRPKIFISHSSKDKELISSFIENILILGLGLNKDDIAFTSHEIYGVKPGDKINQYIKDNIASAEVVLFMISNNYKESEVCLNEMGATWALDKSFISVLLPYAGFEKLGWLTLYEKGIQIYEKDDVVSLCQKISEFLHIDVANRLNALFVYIEKFKNDISRYYRMPIGSFDN